MKRNLFIMWFANFFIAASMTLILPFISLYIDSFGNFSEKYVQSWSGWIFSITFLTALVCAPIWGRLGDKYGRKKILIMSATGLAVSVLLMGFVSSVWELFFLRMFMGLFTGFITISQAFIAIQTPKEHAGRILGTLQTGSITGMLLGPLVGGVIADLFGYAATFKWMSITLFISALLVTFGIKEIQLKVTSLADRKTYTRKEVLQHILSQPVLLIVMLIAVFIQIAHLSIQPILSLYVIELNGLGNIALMSGLTFSVAGLGNLFMAKRWGMLGDKIGHIKILIFLLFLAGLSYFPGAFVTSVWQLIALRFLLGIAIGGMIPVRVAYIRQKAPLSMQGEVLGYNSSLRFLGNLIGPGLGGLLSGFFGFSAVFFFTSGLLVICGFVLLGVWFKYEYEGRDISSTIKMSKH